MSGISKNKKTQFFCFKSDEKKIVISVLFNVFKISIFVFILFKIIEIYMKDPESAVMKERLA